METDRKLDAAESRKQGRRGLHPRHLKIRPMNKKKE
jgi:hypothetical protein